MEVTLSAELEATQIVFAVDPPTGEVVGTETINTVYRDETGAIVAIGMQESRNIPVPETILARFSPPVAKPSSAKRKGK